MGSCPLSVIVTWSHITAESSTVTLHFASCDQLDKRLRDEVWGCCLCWTMATVWPLHTRYISLCSSTPHFFHNIDPSKGCQRVKPGPLVLCRVVVSMWIQKWCTFSEKCISGATRSKRYSVTWSLPCMSTYSSSQSLFLIAHWENFIVFSDNHKKETKFNVFYSFSKAAVKLLYFFLSGLFTCTLTC